MSSEASYCETDEAPKLLDARMAALGKEMLNIKAQPNQLAPISRLPVEILVNIFLECATTNWPISIFKDEPPTIIDMTNTRWTVVSHVCRQWRDTALGAPELWSFLWPTMSAKWLQVMEERSKASPISVFSFEPACDNPSKRDVLLKVVSEPARWKIMHLHLTNGDAVVKLIPSLTSPAPFLVDLSITAGLSHDSLSLPRGFLGGSAPSLRRLHLSRCHPSWNPGLFPRSLTSLTLANPPFVTGVLDAPSLTPSSHVLGEILSRIPFLTTLDLEMLLPDMATLDGTTFNFPFLYKLRLVGKCRSLVGLLGRIRMPSTTVVNISCSEVKEGDLILLGVALERAWDKQPIFTRLRLRDRFRGQPRSFEGFRAPTDPDGTKPRTSQFLITMDEMALWSPIFEMREVVPFPSPRRLFDTVSWDHVETMDVEYPVGLGATDEEWTSVFETMKQVKDLGLYKESAQEFVDALAHFTNARHKANTVDNMPLPHLEILRLHRCGVILDALTVPVLDYGTRTRATIVALGRIVEWLEQRTSLNAPKLKEVAFHSCGGFTPEVRDVFERLPTLEVAETFQRRACVEAVAGLD